MTFDELAQKLEQEVKKNPVILQKIQKIAADVYTEAQKIAYDERYCMTFKIPEKEIKELITLLGIDVKDLKEAFYKEYGFPPNSQMYGNEYYQILVALYYVFKKLRMERYAKLVLFLILIRMWNGRKYKYIKFCNKSVMEYVISQKLSNRSLASKYRSPLDLIINYFVDTIDKKYGPMILKDKSKLKLFFNQCFVRIDQLFNNSTNTGLANLYFKVHESGEALHTSSVKLSNDNEAELTITDVESKSTQIRKIAELISSTITLSTKTHYPQELINLINQTTRLKKQTIELLAKSLHNPQYKDQLEELIIIMFSRLGQYSPEYLCNNKQLIEAIDKAFIRSKHNKDVEEFKKILLNIADDILKRNYGRTLTSYSSKVAILRALAYIIGYNIITTVCQLKDM